MSYLPYISDADLQGATQKVINALTAKATEVEADFYKNVVDPFSALFDSAYYGLSFSEWVEKEKVRQAQKSVHAQNRRVSRRYSK